MFFKNLKEKILFQFEVATNVLETELQQLGN